MLTFFHLQLQCCHSRGDLYWLPRNAVPFSAQPQLLSCDPACAHPELSQLQFCSQDVDINDSPSSSHPNTHSQNISDVRWRCALHTYGGIFPSPTQTRVKSRVLHVLPPLGEDSWGTGIVLKAVFPVLGTSAAWPSRGESRITPARLPPPRPRAVPRL